MEKSSSFYKVKGLSVLLVDDDELHLLIHEHYLKSMGVLNYKTAKNGLEALNLIEENAIKFEFFSVIFMDYDMPILNGLETAKKIKRMINQQIIPNVPIVAVTTDGHLNEMTFYIDDVLYKPVSKYVFYQKLLEMVN